MLTAIILTNCSFELRLAEAWGRFPSLKAKQTIVEIVEGMLRLYEDGMVHDTE